MIFDHPGVPIDHIERACECGLPVSWHRSGIARCLEWRPAGWVATGGGDVRPLGARAPSAA